MLNYILIFDSILFDFDGVLADTEPIHYDCWLEILAPYGIQPTWDYYQRECIGISDRLMVERISTPELFDEIWPSVPHLANARKTLMYFAMKAWPSPNCFSISGS